MEAEKLRELFWPLCDRLPFLFTPEFCHTCRRWSLHTVENYTKLHGQEVASLTKQKAPKKPPTDVLSFSTKSTLLLARAMEAEQERELFSWVFVWPVATRCYLRVCTILSQRYALRDTPRPPPQNNLPPFSARNRQRSLRPKDVLEFTSFGIGTHHRIFSWTWRTSSSELRWIQIESRRFSNWREHNGARWVITNLNLRTAIASEIKMFSPPTIFKHYYYFISEAASPSCMVKFCLSSWVPRYFIQVCRPTPLSLDILWDWNIIIIIVVSGAEVTSYMGIATVSNSGTIIMSSPTYGDLVMDDSNLCNESTVYVDLIRLPLVFRGKKKKHKK